MSTWKPRRREGSVTRSVACADAESKKTFRLSHEGAHDVARYETERRNHTLCRHRATSYAVVGDAWVPEP